MNEVKMTLEDYDDLYRKANELNYIKEIIFKEENWSLNWNGDANLYVGNSLDNCIKVLYPKETEEIRKILMQKDEGKENE